MILAQKQCAQIGVPFAEVFQQQFVVSEQASPALTSFESLQIGTWRIEYGPALPVICVRSKHNRTAVFLGIAADPENDSLFTQDLLAQHLTDALDIDDFFNRMAGCAGRYATFAQFGTEVALELDAVGSLGAVFDAETKRIGSTVSLLLDRDVVDNTNYVLNDAAHRGSARYAFSHTQDLHIKRLLPNHRLNMNSFVTYRVWPHAGDITELNAPAQNETLWSLANKFRSVLGCFAQIEEPPILPLSGGVDSRLLLACAKPFRDQFEYISHATNRKSGKDTRIARRMANAVQVSLHVIDARDGGADCFPSQDSAHYLSQLHCIATSQQIRDDAFDPRVFAAMHALPKDRVVLRGNVADFLKAVLWRRAVKEYSEGKPHNPNEGVRMMMLGETSPQQSESLSKEYRQWYQGFTGTAAQRPFDFMFSEQFLSHGLGNMFYGFLRNFYLCPFNSRTLLAAAISLPPDQRAMLDFHDMILAEWAPELAGIRYTRDWVTAQQRTKVANHHPVD